MKNNTRNRISLTKKNVLEIIWDNFQLQTKECRINIYFKKVMQQKRIGWIFLKLFFPGIGE